MPLSAGTRLGPYEIRAQIGAGGMGEVYRARDTKLNRDVAIKVIPVAFAQDPDRMARFEREAKVLASLNHPNIAAIYGVEDRALIMELVEGESPKGPMPFDDAWKIASQIAAALEYAHERGIVHRDLKPENIKVTSDGVVKLLDFGLAKALSNQKEPTENAENSPTLTLGATEVGMILGTGAYMAPEQARGKKVDKRVDIWSFGVVVYEMLAGERLFQGEDTVQVLSKVLEQQIDLDRIPPRFRKLVGRCLDRNPKDRLRDIGEARFWLEEAAATQAPAVSPRGLRSRLGFVPWGVVCVLGLALAALATVHLREKPPAPAATRFEIEPPEKGTRLVYAVPSPDGSQMALAGFAATGAFRLWNRSLASGEVRLLGDVRGIAAPFWSPDGRSIAYTVGGKLMKVEAAGGRPQLICEVPGARLYGGAWNRSGTILFGFDRGIYQVSAAGGIPAAVTLRDSSRGELFHTNPAFLTDGRHFLYARGSDVPEHRGIYIGSLDVAPDKQDTRRLVASEFNAVYAPSPGDAPGYVLFLRGETLVAQRFDASRRVLTGEAVTVDDPVVPLGGIRVNVAVSDTGVLAYRRGTRESRHLTWFDRSGKATGSLGDVGDYNSVSLSPNGSKAAVMYRRDIWLLDIARGLSTRFTLESPPNNSPIWSPDGRFVVYSSARGGAGDLYLRASNGGGGVQLLLKSGQSKTPQDWSHDGSFLLYTTQDSKTLADLWVLPVTKDGKVAGPPVVFARTEANEWQGMFSPDGRWIAYVSNESGVDEVYVKAFSAGGEAGGKWLVSKGGGVEPRWRRDGKELFYRSPDNSIMSVDVSGGTAFQFEIPRVVFQLPDTPRPGVQNAYYDVSPDGQRFLVNTFSEENMDKPFTVVMNWTVLLKK